MNIRLIILSLSLLCFLQSQDKSILPAQKTAIKTLAVKAGFSSPELQQHIKHYYGLTLNSLSQEQGAELIRSFQSGLISKETSPIINEFEKQKPHQHNLIPILEVGMVKRFHFKDGSVRKGEIVTVLDGNATLKTNSGSFTIPQNEFLAETAEIKNKNGESFTGMVMGETTEEFIIRTKYGDAVVQKREIANMKRYYGGVLDKQTENTRRFYKGTDELTSVFLDPTAFPLATNTFYISGLSIGYGLTDNLMMTTRFGSNFSGDLNLRAKMKFYHKDTANKEVAAAWGLGVHRAYSPEDIISQYSHVINLQDGAPFSTFNEAPVDVNDIVAPEADNNFHAFGYLVFSSRTTNPSGRGKVGWTVGAKTTTAFLDRDAIIVDSLTIQEETFALSWSDKPEYEVPFRIWLGLEYDLRKNLKFLSSAWIDNGYKTMSMSQTWDDYIGVIGDRFSIDSPRGTPTLIDFDFGIQYAVNESFRIGIHFQQPFLDIYWEFFEF